MAKSSNTQSTIVALLLAGTFIAILNQTLMITAIPPIMDEMNITANSAQWLTTVFMLVNGIMIPISAFLYILVAFFALKNVTEVSKPKVDVLSIVLSTLGFGGLLYGFTCAGNFGWTNSTTLLTLGIGALTLVLFITRQLKLKHPMLEFGYLSIPCSHLRLLLE